MYFQRLHINKALKENNFITFILVGRVWKDKKVAIFIYRSLKAHKILH